MADFPVKGQKPWGLALRAWIEENFPLLSSGKVQEVNLPTRLGASSLAPSIQVFTANGTWTKPAGRTLVEVAMVGGGAGGGSGRRGAAGTARAGGAGGGGGGRSVVRLAASTLPSTVAVVVGAGGAGGAAVTTDDTNGNPGSAGLASTFLWISNSTGVRTYGPGSTLGGTNVAVTGGASGGGTFNGGVGGSGSIAATAGAAGSLPGSGASGGGGGGGISAANVVYLGGTSYDPWDRAPYVGKSSGANGDDRLIGEPLGAGGGGGGNAVLAAIGMAGGNGGRYGGGGGGGAASENGFASGKGGNGGAGLVVVTCW